MFVDSNYPYQRVSQDNSVVDGALIGMGVGGVAAGGTIAMSRINYSGIEQRRDHQVSKLDSKLNQAEARRLDEADRYGKNMAFLENRRNKTSPPNENSSKPTFRERINNGYNQVIDHAVDKSNRSHSSRVEKIINQMSELEQQRGILTHSDYLSNAQKNHMYNKMGGWKTKAGIVGASAIVGGGIGVVTDAVTG